MTMAQQYSDARPDYPEGCGPLQDLGFDVIPQLNLRWLTNSDYSNIADIWIVTSYFLFFFVLVPLFLSDPVLVVTRFLWCMSYGFIVRAATVLSTRYPRLPFKSANYHPSNVLWGSILIVLGVRTTATDMMFSAHTFGWFMTASFVSRYSNYSRWSWLYWAFNLTGVILLLSVREHYTSDVVVGAVFSKLIFWVYHLALDDEYIRFTKPGVELVAPHMTRFALPATLTDALGNQTRIEPEGWQYVKDFVRKAYKAVDHLAIPALEEGRTRQYNHHNSKATPRHEEQTYQEKQQQQQQQQLCVTDTMIVPNTVVRTTHEGFLVVDTAYRYKWSSYGIYRFFKWLDGT